MSVPELIILALTLASLVGILGWQAIVQGRAYVKAMHERSRFLHAMTIYLDRKNMDK